MKSAGNPGPRVNCSSGGRLSDAATSLQLLDIELKLSGYRLSD